MRSKLLALVCAALVVGACADRPTEATAASPTGLSLGNPNQLTGTVSMPTALNVTLEAADCDNSPGPYITLSGVSAIAGLGSNVIFRNNAKGTHEHTEDGTLINEALVPAGETLTIPKQPVEGGVGGNPFIWVQWVDGDGSALSGEVYVGRCVQGFRADVGYELTQVASAVVNYTVTDCNNNPGPFIGMDGGLALGGAGVRVIFRNNDNPVGGPHENQQSASDVSLIGKGRTISFAKQPVNGGVGGNPWIWAQFTDGNGTALSDEGLLGRCVQIDNG